jgi:hypothetical protein
MTQRRSGCARTWGYASTQFFKKRPLISEPRSFQAKDDRPDVCCATGFGIPDDVMRRHTDDVEYVAHLTAATLTCKSWCGFKGCLRETQISCHPMSRDTIRNNPIAVVARHRAP